MTSEWVWISLVAVFWGAYPLVTRACGYEGPWATLLVGVIAVAPVIAYVLWQGGAYARPSQGQLGALALAGLMQGVGLIAFLRVASGSLEASVAIPISDVAMLIVTAIGALVFFEEAVTLQKLFGLGLLVTGIALLRPA